MLGRVTRSMPRKRSRLLARAMIAPYLDEEIAWALRYHQALRYFPDESVGYAYPESYHRFFGG